LTAPKSDPQAAEAISLVSTLHRQADGLRAELLQLRENLAQVKMEFSETQGARLVEANENLVMAVLRAETEAETAASDLDELTSSSHRDAMLRMAIDSAQIGEWELDLADGTIRHSLRHDMCFGHDERQAEWNVDILLQCIHPDDRPEFEQSLRHAMQQLTDWQTICRVVWPDASVHWISMRGGICRDDDHPPRLLGIITEITDIKLAEEAHQKLECLELENRQMLEASRLKSQFISNMSHELRTPLNAIIGFSDLLYMGAVAPDSPKQKEFLGHIGSSARHLLHLINDVLDLSKIESGKFQFYPETVDLKQLVSELAAVLHTSFQRRGLHLEGRNNPRPAGGGLSSCAAQAGALQLPVQRHQVHAGWRPRDRADPGGRRGPLPAGGGRHRHGHRHQ